MQSNNVDSTIKQLQQKIKQFEREQELLSKPILLNEANQLLKKLENQIKLLGKCYTQERLERQVELVKQKLVRLEKEMMDEIRFEKIRGRSKGMGVSRLSVAKVPLESTYKYNPRQTIQQNILRTIVWKEVTDGQMLLKPEELEEIAKKMEANKDVIDQIDYLVKQQGEKLDIIDSRIMSAHRNVVEANKHMDQANVLYGGKARQPEPNVVNNRSSIRRANSSEVIEPEQPQSNPAVEPTHQQPQPDTDKIVMSLRGKVRGFFGNIGYKISQVWNYLFSKKE